MLVFQMISFCCNSSSNSVMMTRSPTYRFAQGHPVWNSRGKASRTMMNSKGLKQEPWWMPTFTLNSSLRLQPTCTLLLAFAYMLCMSRASHSSMPSLPRAHQMTRLGTRSNAFFRSTKAMYSVCGAASRHETKLHNIDAHLLLKKVLSHPLWNLHDLV